MGRATEHRASLDERDRMLLRYVEATIADPPLPAGEPVRQLRALVERFPEDAEVQALLGMSLTGFQTPETAAEGQVVLGRALRLDPEFAGVIPELVESRGLLAGYAPEELALLARCLEIAPRAGTCIRERARVNANLGRCEDVADDARRLAVIEPKRSETYELLAASLAAKDAPVEVVHDALAKRVELQADDRQRRIADVQTTLWTATLAGDLGSAEQALRAWDAIYSDSLVADDHVGPFLFLLDVLEEEGDAARTADAADAYQRRASGWTGAIDGDDAARIAYARFRGGHLDAAGLESALARAEHDMPAADRASLELEGARTQAEAAAALSLVPDVGAIVPRWNALFQATYPGRAYLLAGQVDRALPWLRVGAASCAILPGAHSVRAYPIWWMRAHEMLGAALEQTNDKAGACEAYAIIRTRWKDAKPRSVTLEKAIERSRALACPEAARGSAVSHSGRGGFPTVPQAASGDAALRSL